MKDKIIPKEPCKKHKVEELSYLAWHEYAKERTQNGDKQTECKVCGRWYFENEL
jgi:hypothetical protein